MILSSYLTSLKINIDYACGLDDFRLVERKGEEEKEEKKKKVATPGGRIF